MSMMEEQSDDEIFFGKLTTKEIKRRITLEPRVRACLENNTFDNHPKTQPDASFKIIETHSAPNLLSLAVKQEQATFYSTPGSPALNPETGEDSFVNLENKVSELCVDPRTSDNVELNNTLEIVNYILNNGPKEKTEHITPIKNDENDENLPSNIKRNTYIDEGKEKSLLTYDTFKETGAIGQAKTPYKDIKMKHQKEQIQVDSTEQYFTPVKSESKTEVFATLSSRSVKLKPPVLKTPAPPSNKKPVTSAKKTPNRTNAYQHIASPIASYIKNCPQVPLIKNVHPKKPLPGPSSIPKFVKSQPIKLQLQNKENIDLPKVAYKSAKKTVLIDVDEEKLPQSQWAKSTLPRPKVVKHEKREMNPLVQAQQEESFENLSCLQAEVSVCTQKTAFKSNK